MVKHRGYLSYFWKNVILAIPTESRTFCLPLFQERLSEKVQATIPKGIVDSFECTQRVGGGVGVGGGHGHVFA